MAVRTERFSKPVSVASVDISESDMELLSSTALVARLVAGGVSRLTAERFVEIQRGKGNSGRARPHSMSRR
jgi:hypothetical protein